MKVAISMHFSSGGGMGVGVEGEEWAERAGGEGAGVGKEGWRRG